MSLSTIHMIDTSSLKAFVEKAAEIVNWLGREIRAFFCNDLTGRVTAVFQKVAQTPNIKTNATLYFAGSVLCCTRRLRPIGFCLAALALYRTYKEYIALG